MWVIGTSSRAPGPPTFFLAEGTMALASPSASPIA